MTRLPFRITLVAVVAPLLLVVIGVALQLAWLPDVPATIAVHWGADGTADGFAPAWTMPLLLGITGISVPVLFGVILARTVRSEGPTATQKVLAVAGLFAATLLSAGIAGSVAIQRAGAPEASIAPVLGIATATGAALAVAAWFVLPRAVDGRSPAGVRVPAIDVAPGERVVWVGSARFPAGILIAIAAAVVLVSGVAAFSVATAGVWPVVLVPVVLAVAFATTTSWRVRVDAEGFTVRGILGRPAWHVPASDVASATVLDVVPLGEFGGYGIRLGLGRRLGIITRQGDALEVVRRDGRAIVVTVDDAATAAGLLTAYAASSAS